MSAETDYLQSWFTSAAPLSLTVTSAQRSRARPRIGARWELGLCSFGWSNLGGRQRTNGVVTALVFDSRVWFSDRVVNRSQSPLVWQQFAAADSDPVLFRFTLNGERVRLHADLIRWRVAWDADSFGYDAETEQLQFHVPGAGAGSPPAVMLTSFGPGAGFL
jgi:hypothetical protein